MGPTAIQTLGKSDDILECVEVLQGDGHVAVLAFPLEEGIQHLPRVEHFLHNLPELRIFNQQSFQGVDARACFFNVDSGYPGLLFRALLFPLPQGKLEELPVIYHQVLGLSAPELTEGHLIGLSNYRIRMSGPFKGEYLF